MKNINKTKKKPIHGFLLNFNNQREDSHILRRKKHFIVIVNTIKSEKVIGTVFYRYFFSLPVECLRTSYNNIGDWYYLSAY